MISVNCPAKLNLGLKVLGLRPDGYHDLDGVMIPVPWFDQVSVRRDSTVPPGMVVLDVVPDHSCQSESIPLDESNIVWRTAMLCLQSPGVVGLCESTGLAIRLDKVIPAGTGLGGASSDAAGTIIAIDRLARLVGLSGMDSCFMKSVAAAVGSDSVFFLDPRPSRIVGRGESFEPCSLDGRFIAVIAVPVERLVTGAVFGRWEQLRKHNNSGPDALTGRGVGDISPCLSVCASGVSVGSNAPELFENDLSEAVFDLCPRSAQMLEMFVDSSAFVASVTGSGSAVYGLFRDMGSAEASVRTMTRNLLPGEIVRAFQAGSDF